MKESGRRGIPQVFVNKDLYKDLISKGVVVPANVEIPEDASPYLKEMLELTNKERRRYSTALFRPKLPMSCRTDCRL